jgi:hypothetical protein
MERVAVENMMRILLMAWGEGQRCNEGFRSSVGDLDVASLRSDESSRILIVETVIFGKMWRSAT